MATYKMIFCFEIDYTKLALPINGFYYYLCHSLFFKKAAGSCRYVCAPSVSVIFFRSSRTEVLCKKGVLKNFRNLQENTCSSLIFNKVMQLYQKKDSGTGVFL